MRMILICFVSMTLLTSCISESNVPNAGSHPCVGLGETQDPRFVYKLSGWNLFMGILFIEMIVPPIIVVANELFCPVAMKPDAWQPEKPRP